MVAMAAIMSKREQAILTLIATNPVIAAVCFGQVFGFATQTTSGDCYHFPPCGFDLYPVA